MKPRSRHSLQILLGVAAIGLLSAAAHVTDPAAFPLLDQGHDSGPPAQAGSTGGSPSAAQVVVIGDSLSTGHGTSPAMAWPNLVQRDTRGGQHPLAIRNASVNGSGYVSNGDGGSTFLTQVEGSVQKATQLVLVFGSENDMGADKMELKRAVAKTLAEIDAKSPNARIVVVGPPSYTNAPEPSRLQVRDEDRAAAAEAGAVFVDPIENKWIMGQADKLIGPDGDHPSVQGQHYLQANMEKIILGNLPG